MRGQQAASPTREIRAGAEGQPDSSCLPHPALGNTATRSDGVLNVASGEASSPVRSGRVSRFLDRVARSVGRRAEQIRTSLDNRFVRIASHSELLSSFYYAFWNTAFRREHRAFLVGRLKYAELTARPSESVALIRRNTHRLEKGLLMRPRRNVFALDYIEETYQCYEYAVRELQQGNGINSAELTWAHDVLAMYFDVTGSHPKIDPLRSRFRALPPAVSNESCRIVPYKRDLSKPAPVRFHDLMELARHRRSVRWFLPTPVPREAIENAILVAAQSPTACNRQPYMFRVFDEPSLVREVASLPYGTEGYRENIPAIIVVIGKLRNYFDERDRHLIYIDASLAVMGFVYAIEAQGLSTCCINWPDVPEREEKMAETLKLDADERPIMLIAVGYPDPEGMVAYSQKKPIDVLCKFNLS